MTAPGALNKVNRSSQLQLYKQIKQLKLERRTHLNVLDPIFTAHITVKTSVGHES
jgi:hypothetical protein